MTRRNVTFLYRELRRRRVFRTAAYYMVGAWVLLQVCDVVFPIVGFPDSALQFVLAATIVGFPVALIFGWKYDITPQGIKRTPSIAEADLTTDLKLKRVDYLLLAVMVAIAGIIAFQVPLPAIKEQQFSAPPDNSIAVLPFEVCEGQDLDHLMAAGIATEVINRLAERGKLKVLARESSFSFAGFGLRLPEIAEPLGVQHLLTGVLCRNGDALTLSAELSDAKGYLVSSDTYEQAVGPSGKITQRLASAVATSVAAELGDLLPARSDSLVDKLAHEQLIIGREHRARGESEKAHAAFERALEKQPNYAEAKYEIALLELGSNFDPHLGTNIENARITTGQALTLVRRQLEVEPNSAHAQFVAGRIIAVLAFLDEQVTWRESATLDEDELLARGEEFLLRLAEAERHLRTSININPTVTETYDWLAYVVESQGRSNEALEILELAQIRDPFNVSLNANIAKGWVARGNYRRAIELLERFKVLPEIPPLAWWWQLELMELNTYWDEKCETLIEMLLHDPGAFDRVSNRWQAWWFVKSLAMLGLREEAEDWKVRIENMPMPDQMREIGLQHYLEATGDFEVVVTETETRLADMSDEEVLDAFHEQGLAWAWYIADAGQIERAIKLMESIQHAPATWAEREAQAPLLLAELYQQVGRDEDAAQVLDEIVAQLEAEFDYGIRDPTTLTFLSDAYALQNRDDDAVDMFLKAVDYHYRDDCAWLSDPKWERLKDDRRLAAGCKRMQADFEQQADRVRTMLAQHDVDELLAPLMKMASEAGPATATAQ
ncbi:MAG: tetratricopeptide repeat protein [Woeseiaceae bacterium]